VSYYGLGISKKASKQLNRENAKLNREIDKQIQRFYWSEPRKSWKPDLDYLVVVLFPRKWWSLSAWILAIGVRSKVLIRFKA